uniref:Si946063f09 n=1 Tax=Arundo donax TaxID=35708 RepID=A0A0A9ETZ9_ARUDO
MLPPSFSSPTPISSAIADATSRRSDAGVSHFSRRSATTCSAIAIAAAAMTQLPTSRSRILDPGTRIGRKEKGEKRQDFYTRELKENAQERGEKWQDTEFTARSGERKKKACKRGVRRIIGIFLFKK